MNQCLAWFMNRAEQHALAWLPKKQSCISGTPRFLFLCCFHSFCQHRTCASSWNTELTQDFFSVELPWAPPAPWSCGIKSQRVQNNSLQLQWVDSAAHFWGLSQYVSYLGFSWKLDCLADEIKADSKGKRHQKSEATWTVQRKYLRGQQMKVTRSSN